MQVTYIITSPMQQQTCTCNPLMHRNIIISAVHKAHMRHVSLGLMSRTEPLVFYTHQSDLCADEDVRHPGGRTGNFPAEYRGGSQMRRFCLSALRSARVRTRSGMRNAHRAPPISARGPLGECGNTHRSRPISVLQNRTRFG